LLPGGMVKIQLTENITDSVTEPEKFEVIRDAAKKHLDHNAFFQLNSPPLEYQTPTFVFK
jgi:hypothetical protein